MRKVKKETFTNSISLEYLQNAFDTNEIETLSHDLYKSGIKLKTQATKPQHIMGIEALFPQIEVLLSPDIVQTICLGIASSAAWDAVKYFLISLRQMIKKKRFTHIQNGKVDTNATPNIHVDIGKIHVVLPMDIDDNKFEYFVDKMFDEIDKDTITQEKYAFYDDDIKTITFCSKQEVAMESYKLWREAKEKEDERNIEEKL